MLRIKRNNQSEIMENLAIWWFVVSSGFFVLNYVYMIPCMIVLFLIAVCYAIRKKIVLKKNGRKLLVLLMFIAIDEFISLFIYNYPFEINTLIILLIRLFSLAIIMEDIDINVFMKKYVNVFVFISVLSLICFALIQNSSTILPFVKEYQDGFVGSFYFRVNEYSNSIASRNSGPYGEPGLFAVYLIIAFVFHLFSSEDKQIIKGKNGIKTMVLSVTILTTLSLTGLLCYFIVVVAYAIVNFKSANVFRRPITYIIIVVAVVLMFFGWYYVEQTYGILEYKLVNQGGSYNVRIDDTIKGYQIALEHFFTGTGIVNDYTSAWDNVILEDSRSNGLANFAASVGIPFAIYYLFNVFRRSVSYLKGNLFLAIMFFGVLLIAFNTQPIILQTIGLSFFFVWNKNAGESGYD